MKKVEIVPLAVQEHFHVLRLSTVALREGGCISWLTKNLEQGSVEGGVLMVGQYGRKCRIAFDDYALDLI